MLVRLLLCSANMQLKTWIGQRLNDNALKQAAWDVINSNTVGVWLPIVQVSGTDVVNPINEVSAAAIIPCEKLKLFYQRYKI